MPPTSALWQHRRVLLELTALYCAEGLPFGFFAQGLPVLFRKEGASLTKVGLLGLLFLPWALKWLWAPIVDSTGLARLGRRRTWILGTQLSMVILMGAVALLLGEQSIQSLMPVVVISSFLSATQDVAVDGYAVSRLTPELRGVGNAIQVCGYKLGMVISGGGLLVLAGSAGWQTSLGVLALLLLLITPVAMILREPNEDVTDDAPRALVQTVRDTMGRLIKAPGAWALLLFCFLVKVGEAAAGQMLKPALVDKGFSVEEIGLWVGTVGLVVSLLGSAVGGWMAVRLARHVALAWAVGLQAVGIAVLIPLLWMARDALVLGIVVEHFVTGVLTTVLFTRMMDAVDPRHGGTQYSVLASLVVVGTGIGGTLSGLLADAVGYSALFAGATLLTVACLALMPRIPRP